MLEGLQEFPTLNQMISLEIGPKCTTSDYKHGHIIWELRTRDILSRFPLVYQDKPHARTHHAAISVIIVIIGFWTLCPSFHNVTCYTNSPPL